MKKIIFYLLSILPFFPLSYAAEMGLKTNSNQSPESSFVRINGEIYKINKTNVEELERLEINEEIYEVEEFLHKVEEVGSSAAPSLM